MLAVKDKFIVEIEKVYQDGFRAFNARLYQYMKIGFSRLSKSPEEFFYLSSLWFTVVKSTSFERRS